MSFSTNRHLAMILGIICMVLCVISVFLLWNYTMLTIRLAWAREQTETFEEMRTQALRSDAAAAADCLEYVVLYYPSGTKQKAGSQIDAMVERDRELTIRDIIANLRVKTGLDLGENPDAWIQEFVKK